MDMTNERSLIQFLEPLVNLTHFNVSSLSEIVERERRLKWIVDKPSIAKYRRHQGARWRAKRQSGDFKWDSFFEDFKYVSWAIDWKQGVQLTHSLYCSKAWYYWYDFTLGRSKMANRKGYLYMSIGGGGPSESVKCPTMMDESIASLNQVG